MKHAAVALVLVLGTGCGRDGIDHSVNLVANASFEQAASGHPDAWWPSTSGSSVDVTRGHTGRRSLKLEGPSEAYTFVEPPLKPDHDYAISFWLRIDAPLAGQGAGMRYAQIQPPAETLIWQSMETAETDGWRRFSATFRTRGEQAQGRLDVIWGMVAGDVAWIDDVALWECWTPSCAP